MRITILSLFTILCIALSAPAFADNTLYNNGPTNGGVNGWFIGQGQSYVVSDSFQVSVNADIESFTFAQWVTAGSTPTTVDWALGSTSFGTDLTGGYRTADISGSPIFCHASGTCGLGFYDVYNSTVTFNSIDVAGGPNDTYLADPDQRERQLRWPHSVGHKLRPINGLPQPTRFGSLGSVHHRWHREDGNDSGA